jgi:hypothetical protein
MEMEKELQERPRYSIDAAGYILIVHVAYLSC